jgi:hypothetical protein
MEDVVSERPDATAYAFELDSRAPFDFDTARLTVRCGRCRARLGGIFDTEHGQLWIGLLGAQRDGRSIRRSVYARAAEREADGRNAVPVWVEPWRTNYMCDCECRRNCADAAAIHSALLDRRRSVTIGPQP